MLCYVRMDESWPDGSSIHRELGRASRCEWRGCCGMTGHSQRLVKSKQN